MQVQSYKDGKAFERERYYLSLVSHQNIVEFYGSTFNPSTSNHGLVMEYAECGTLYECEFNLFHK